MKVDIFGGVVGTLERALNLRAARHGALLSNLANMDNPNYRGFDIMVEEEMRKTDSSGLIMKVSHPGHIAGGLAGPGKSPFVEAELEDAYSDGKGVLIDRDKTMAELSRNHLMYTATVRIMAKKLEGLKQAIQDGRS